MLKQSIWKIAGLSLVLSCGAPLYIQAQLPPNDLEQASYTPAQERSYAYGAMMAKGLQRSNLTAEEKDANAFVKGFEKGLAGDKEVFEAAQAAIRTRLQGGAPATGEAAKQLAYQLGVTAFGGLTDVIKIPATDFDFAAMLDGYVTVSEGRTPRMSDEQMNKILQDYFQPINERYQAEMKKKQEVDAAENIKAGKDFLAENAKKKGVITLPSGLQYEIIKEGTGAKATINDKVETHYHGTLINGKVFDSSVDRGQPATFPVNGVIKGWQEGIPLMKEGAKYRFYIPQELAYGLQSPSPSIPAGSTLIFDVELITVNPGQKELMQTIQAGEAFLKKNSERREVVTLPSGLQYEIIKKGNSDQKPTVSDRVKVHYHGTLIDGTVFDSSVERGQPAVFGVGQVIQGWQEGIPLMSPGAKYKFYIPYNLAYGKNAAGAKIPGGSTLIFEVELFEINPQ